MSTEQEKPEEKEGEGKRGVGRPTEYDPKYCEQANKLCKLGATDEEMADFFDVSVTTLNNWKEKHPEFLLSIREGKEVADMEVVNNLYNGCFDRAIVEEQAFKVKEVSYDENGKRCESERVEVVSVARAVPGDYRSQQFWLRNRKSKNWREKIETEHSGIVTTAGADIVKNLSDGALKELREAHNTDSKRD